MNYETVFKLIEDVKFQLNKLQNTHFQGENKKQAENLLLEIENELIYPDNFVNIKNYLPVHITVKLSYGTCSSDCGYTYFKITLIDMEVKKIYRFDFCIKCKTVGLHIQDISE